MDSKRALVFIIGFPCTVMLFFILMACLWEYRIIVGASLLLLLFLVVGVIIRGWITEQNLRPYRFDHTTETPLDLTNEPKFWRPDMKENPYRYNGQVQGYYQGYQQEVKQ
jgi:hypothetical protein